MKKAILLLVLLSTISVQAQIIIDNTVPYNTATYLIDNILLGGGITATTHSFIGDPNQIGFFNGVNSNLGIDSGIVLSSGNVFDLVGPNASGSTSTSFLLPGDPTLDAVIFPDPTNDAAVLEFDFIPTSDTISFKYVFGSEEYLEWVNSFNDAFGFFLSGPNPAGGNYIDQNLAIIPGTTTPVTIDNVNNVVNPTYYIDNGDGFTAPQNTDPTVIQFDGFTTPLTAVAAVNCGDTYHIKLVVADAVDNAYDSGVFLEAGSFYSPPLSVVDDLSIDSILMEIPCNSTITLTADGGIGATYEWFDSTSTVFSTAASVTVGSGQYIVSANISGCSKFSDTLIVIADVGPTIDLGPDITIPCNADILIDPIVSGGTTPYSYLWNSGDSDSMLVLSEGVYSIVVTDLLGCSGTDTLEIIYDAPPVVDLGSDYNIPCNTNTILLPNIVGGTPPYSYLWNNGLTDPSIDISEGNFMLTVSDFYGCSDSDEINITEDPIPHATISGGGSVCDDGSTVDINFAFNGLLPWDLTYTNGSVASTINDIVVPNYSISTIIAGNYAIVLADDINDCIADTSAVGKVEVIINPLPVAVITPNDITIYLGDEVELTTGNYAFYEWYTEYDSLISNNEIITVQDSGRYKVWVEDENGCTDMSELAIVRSVPLTQLFVPTAFTPNDDEHNELFVIKGIFVETFNIKIFDKWG
ncbi:MAG: choice-of-anchor L domain-containing protein, partial [Bacteroidota bacterium]|nr:choice-of-anchor L domain-containing protein [Bacteroidota bacterium]